MEYEGKDGLIKLKKIADSVGLKYDQSWGKGRLINEMLAKSDIGNINKAISGQKIEKMKEEEKKKEEKLKEVLPIPENDDEARATLPRLFYSKNEMVAAAQAYGLDMPVAEMNLSDTTEFVVGMGKDVWEDFAKMDHTDEGELLFTDFGLKSFGKGSKEEVDAFITDYKKEMKEGQYTFMMDSRGDYHKVEAATRITIGEENFVRFAFGPVLTMDQIRNEPELGPEVS